METRLLLSPKPPFDFVRTVRAHGWIWLAPNGWDGERQTMTRVERLRSGQVVLLTIGGAGAPADPIVEVTVDHVRDLSTEARTEIGASVAWMLRADEDLFPFYALCRDKGGPWLRVLSGQGRLLRSPSLFEDVVRTILTTNIQWSGTVRMVRALVDAFGEPYPGDGQLRAFPTVEAITAMPLDQFAQVVRMGYRSAYVHGLATDVASGTLDLEALRDATIPTADVRRKLLAIKGVGEYAAATLLMLLGRYSALAVDTEFRQFVTDKYFAGQRVADEVARSVYDDWGDYKYLAHWFDLASG